MDALKQSFRMALKSIAGNKLRAFLTMLGIIIGVMALVILVSLVNGATGTVTNAISDLGTNLLTVSVYDSKGKPLMLDELKTYTADPAIGATAACVSESVTAKGQADSDSVTLYGTTASYYDIQGMKMLLGRYIQSADVDNHTHICVINETAAEELVGYAECLGESLSLDGVRFTVVGVLEDDDDSLTAAFISGTKVIYIPYTSLVRLTDSVPPTVSTFYASAAEGRTVADAEEALSALLTERFDGDEDAFHVTTLDILEDAMDSITSILSVLLGGIPSISLLVGGIGIMNIMLVTVTERTREIGIRKAIGATRGAILRQFLIESVMLCMLGCFIGIGLSWGILRAIGVVVASLDIHFNMDASVVILSVLFCFCIGVGFGLYPANKAAKMKPIDALHYGG